MVFPIKLYLIHPNNMMSKWSLVIAGVVLILKTFPSNALITKLLPVPVEISQKIHGQHTKDILFKEPLSEKVIYPLPPGVTQQTAKDVPSSTSVELKAENVVSTTEATLPVEEKSIKTSVLMELNPSTEGPLAIEASQFNEEMPIIKPVFTETTEATTLEKFSQSESTLHAGVTHTEKTISSSTIAPTVEVTTSPTVVSELILNVKSCTTPIGKNGECKDIFQCPTLVNLLMREPLLVENKLYLQRSQCGFENKTVLACCPDNVPGPIISPKWSLLPKPGNCGKMQENRLYGGYFTEIDSYRWLALLEYSKGKNKTELYCGGALISDRYVLTAAHCVSGLPETWYLKSVRLGEWDTANNMDCSKHNVFEDCADPPITALIEEIIPHKDYVPLSNNQLHDIALIRLSNSINSTDFIEPICLPHGENNLHGFDEQCLDVVGWGASPKGLWSTIKQRASASVIQFNNCRSKYAERNITLEASQFCVEGRTKNDTCHVDSGGPLISFDTSNKGLGNYFIAGIQSFGPSPCWIEGLPGVNTRVAEYLDWILDNIHV